MDRDQFRFLDTLRVRWAEVDMQKIVFNGHYLMYLDTAVAGYWRALAMPYHETLEPLGGDLYVRKATVEYLASARYDERLEVGLRCQRIGNSSITYAAAIFREERALVTGELVYVFADPATQRSRPVPPPLREALEAFEVGASMVRPEPGDWAALGETVRALRERAQEEPLDPSPPAGEAGAAPPPGPDVGCEHLVLRNRFGLAVAAARLRRDGHEGSVEAVVVHPDVRGSGLGRQLLAELGRLAAQRGCRNLHLVCGRATEGFFARQGFACSALTEGAGEGAGAAAPGQPGRGARVAMSRALAA